jgi:5-oxoprolinase (ATP-hydrolysing)
MTGEVLGRTPKPSSTRAPTPPKLAAPALADEPPGRGAWSVSIDRGGTFTDVVMLSADGRVASFKVPTDPADATSDAAVEEIRRRVGAPAGEPIAAMFVREVRIGTTAATNALLERRGERCALLVTKGFADLLTIGTQERPSLFALNVVKTPPLATDVFEIDERVLADGTVRRPLDFDEVRAVAREIRRRGIRSAAVVFLHAYAHPEHERAAKLPLQLEGVADVAVSHESAREIQAVPRGETTVADAYLTPVLRRAMLRFASAFSPEVEVRLMKSDGGLCYAALARGPNAVLSGPAGGALGVARVAKSLELSAAIGFDMGGTSTDVCRVAPDPDFRYETKIAGLRLRVPSLRVHTVAAGGGSILSFDGRRLRVGPESAGAHPGPAGYGRGGPPTITDANAVLGRLVVSSFPTCFGDDGAGAFDVDASRRAIAPLAKAAGLSVEEMAAGFVKVGDELVAQAIREESVLRGYDVRTHALVAFGGAGPQHACAVAAALGVTKVVVPRLASVLSAWGIAGAVEAAESVTPVLRPLDPVFCDEARRIVAAQSPEYAKARVLVELRVLGADATLVVPLESSPELLRDAFAQAHRHAYGFGPTLDAEIEVVNVRVRTERTRAPDARNAAIDADDRAASIRAVQATLKPRAPRTLAEYLGKSATAWFDRRGEFRAHRVPVLASRDVPTGRSIEGPVLVVDDTTTLVVAPGWRIEAESATFVLAPCSLRTPAQLSIDRDPVTLTLFANRFMSIAERMGAVLERTSHSTNIKERLDFSCALFDSEGRLVANAPHIPVHLGAMGESVRAVAASRGDDLRDGDVILTNDPYRGGSHLPDITAVTPVLVIDGSPRFWVANRAHHADIGGTTPGSMPPLSTSIDEEGALVHDLLIVRDGVFFESDVRRAFEVSRAVDERVADFRAQAAANAEGARLLLDACTESGTLVVSAYMGHVLDDGAAAMEEMLARLPCGKRTMNDVMDDGTRMCVSIEIADRRAIVDFAGTGPRSRGNLNAPKAVTRAAVLYAFRCLIGRDIPLNEGCLRPIDIRIPDGCLLAPDQGEAVVGGNVETSMRIVDLVLGALGACAASQGTMNNVTFGVAGRPYYETLGGGGGAGPTFDGASAIQLHMTNTRITDVEVVETRYPVVIRRFAVRRGSGGAGAHRGGDGLVREYEFLAPASGGVLSERRAAGAFGLGGGERGAPGRNVIIRGGGDRPLEGRLQPTPMGEETVIPGRAAFECAPGDVLRVETPGGGGFGAEGRRPDP